MKPFFIFLYPIQYTHLDEWTKTHERVIFPAISSEAGDGDSSV